MRDSFDIYDTSAIAKPNAVAERLLGQTDDDVHSLAVSDCFDLEDGDEDHFNEAFAALNRDFAAVLAKLSKSLGHPNYSGAAGDKGMPSYVGPLGGCEFLNIWRRTDGTSFGDSWTR